MWKWTQPFWGQTAGCEMLSHYPQSAYQGFPLVAGGCQQQFATQTLRVHLLGIDPEFITNFGLEDALVFLNFMSFFLCPL